MTQTPSIAFLLVSQRLVLNFLLRNVHSKTTSEGKTLIHTRTYLNYHWLCPCNIFTKHTKYDGSIYALDSQHYYTVNRFWISYRMLLSSRLLPKDLHWQDFRVPENEKECLGQLQKRNQEMLQQLFESWIVNAFTAQWQMSRHRKLRLL